MNICNSSLAIYYEAKFQRNCLAFRPLKLRIDITVAALGSEKGFLKKKLWRRTFSALLSKIFCVTCTIALELVFS